MATRLNLMLAKRIRDQREVRGWTRDDLGDRARRGGLDWSGVTVTDAERGRRAVDLGELLVLASVFGVAPVGLLDPLDVQQHFDRLAHEPIDVRELALIAAVLNRRVGDLLPSDDDDGDPHLPQGRTIRLTNRVLVSSPQLRDALVERRRVSYGVMMTPEDAAENERRLQEQPAPGEAEYRAARELGASPQAVVVESINLWGHLLTAERDTRADERTPADASERSRAGIRGGVTRQLMDELREHLDKIGYRRTKGNGRG